MYIILDDNNYFTGEVVEEKINNAVEVDELPKEHSLLKLRCYKYENGKLIFDEDKYNGDVVSSFDSLKKSKIQNSKYDLEKWLKTNTLFSTCHNKDGEYYTITQEKQNRLIQTLNLAQLSIQSNLPFVILWNSTTGISEEWTIEELSTLAFEINQYVRPRIVEQQRYEHNVLYAQTLEEIKSYSYNYDTVEKEL